LQKSGLAVPLLAYLLSKKLKVQQQQQQDGELRSLNTKETLQNLTAMAADYAKSQGSIVLSRGASGYHSTQPRRENTKSASTG
jgi:hypothetical protein